MNVHQPLSEAGQAALSLAHKGWPVFPCDHRVHRCKRPLTPNGFKDASTDPVQVETWWRQWPDALIGVPTGPRSGIWAVDLDLDLGKGIDGLAAVAQLEAAHEPIPITVETRTPRGGRHLLFAWDAKHPVANSSGSLPPGIDIRGDGGYVILPPSKREDGASDRWENPPGLFQPVRAPTWLYELIRVKRDDKAKAPRDEQRDFRQGDDVFAFQSGPSKRELAWARAALDGSATDVASAPQGQRNTTLNAVAYKLGRLVARGWLSRAEVELRLLAASYANGLVNDDGELAARKTICSGLDAGELHPRDDLPGGDDGAQKRTDGGPKAEQSEVEPQTLAEVHAIFRKWFGDEYDIDAINATLAAAASEKLSGDPLWLLLISGPGNAKTETVQALAGAGAHVTSTIASEGALLSATPRRERNKKATGGLLRKIGDRGLLVVKDVTSILSADRNTRASVLAAIREIYVGRWERNVGTDGGQTLTWVGRIVLIGAVTTAWDAAHAVVAAMGDRFVLIRMDSSVGRMKAGERAIRNTGDEVAMREQLAATVAGLIGGVDAGSDYVVHPDEIERLLKAADIVTYARTAVERDYQGEVIDAHAPEMPTRFAKQLTQMVRGGLAIGLERSEAIRLAIRCARDSVPPLRLEILLDLASFPGSRPGDVRKRISRPWRTVKREMEALYMLSLLQCQEEHEGFAEERTVWRYKLAAKFDRKTLLAMAAGRIARNVSE